MYTTSRGGVYFSDLDVQCANNCFDKWKGLINIEGLQYWSPEKAHSLRGLFNNDIIESPQLEYISGWDVSNVSNMMEMFNATNITSVSALKDWKPKQLADMYRLFNSSKDISDLDDLNDWGLYFENTKLGNNPSNGTTSWVKNTSAIRGTYGNVQAGFNANLSNWASPSHGRFTMSCDNDGKLTVTWASS